VGGSHESGEKGGPSGLARTAEEPGQTANVDLCFVPATHEAQQRLPAVSGSSGRLVVTPVRETAEEHTWPGQIFEDPGVAYEDAMTAFALTAAASLLPPPEQETDQEEQIALLEHHRRHHNQEMILRAERSAQRAQRRQEDRAWQDLCAVRRASPDRRRRSAAARETAAAWREQRAQRRAVLAQRRQEDALWQQQHQALQETTLAVPFGRRWIAVLVLTDNCTRQCLGLPLFEAGPKVTADMVCDALRTLLPPELQFLVSDRGIHFTARAMARLAREAEFVHVLIARHRPQSNGIAERFVRTLKEWLAAQTWDTAPALTTLLAQFRAEYNERPHQGVGLPGLSPAEFAQRIWLL
jgi:transposase InsO family protein